MAPTKDTAVETTHPPRTTSVRVIATFDDYEQAQALVDRLADDGFPVERMTIVGRDLQMVEKVTGQLDAGRSALMAALSVIPIALLFGLLFGVIFAPTGVTLLATVVYWVAVGAIAGALYGLVMYYAFNGGRRNFTSTSGVRATRYDVLADESVADDALRRIQADPTTSSSGR
jgi:hypothetical protein